MSEISFQQKSYLRGRAAHIKTFAEREQELEVRAEQKRIQAELQAFSDALHEFALTAEGRKAADSVAWWLVASSEI